MSPVMTGLGQGKWLAIGIMLAAFMIGAVALTYTRFGRHTLAVGGNEDASKLMGLNVRSVLTGVYMLSGSLAGLAGVMLASQNGAGDPNAGIGWELGAITSVVVGGTLLTGGVGSVWATLAGATLIGLIRNMLNFENGLGVLTLSSYWQSVITGALLLLVVVLQSRLARREQDLGA
jgi:galactofuranose transport system permease protein